MFIRHISVLFLLASSVITANPEFLQRTLTDYYLPDYSAARKAFLALEVEAKAKYHDVTLDRYFVPSQVDHDLSMDSLFIPAQGKPKGLVVFVSGIHGIEAYAGSAIQRYLITERLLGKDGLLDTDETGYLFVHVVNPYGFKYERRVTESNVDENRNFSTDRKLFQTKNPGYAKLNDFLNPTTRASASWSRHFLFLYESVQQLWGGSLAQLREAIGQGQYDEKFKLGVEYGGTDFEPQKEPLEQLLLSKSHGYQKVLIIDLHTGFGRRAHMHLLPNPPADKDKARLEKRWKLVFGTYPVDSAGANSAEFYSSYGDFSEYAGNLLEARGKQTVPMLIEFGTLNSQTYQGSVKTLSRLILENQAHWWKTVDDHGYSANVIHHNFREMFFPSAPDWRMEVMQQAALNLPVFVDNFRKQNL